MKRYIKLEGKWIDTYNSAELDIEYYLSDDGYIYRYFHEDDVEECCGKLQGESDIEV